MQDQLYHRDQDHSIQSYDYRGIEPYTYNPQNHNQITFSPTINIRVDASDQSNREESHKYSYSIPASPQRIERTDDTLRWQNTFFLMAMALIVVATIGGFRND